MKISSQSKLCLVNRTGKLETSKITRSNGLCDVVNFKTLKKGTSHPFKIAFDAKGATYGCLDRAGNVTVFHMDKNRYSNVDVQVDSSNLTFIDNKGVGLLMVSFADCSIGVYNILNGKLVQQLKWHRFKVKKMQVHASSGVILSVTAEDCVLWDIATFYRKKTFSTKSSRFLAAGLSASGNRLITFSQNGVIESFNVETQQLERSEDTGLKGTSALLEISVEGEYFAIAGETQICLVGRVNGGIGENGEAGACFGVESYQLPAAVKKALKMKFIGNSLLTVLGDDQRIYTFSVKNHMEVVMAFELPTKKGIIDYDLSIEAKHLVVISTLGEKYVYDFHQLIANQKSQPSQISLKNGSFARESLRRVDLDDIRNETLQREDARRTAYQKENNVHVNQRSGLTAPSDLVMIDKVGGATGNTEIYVNGSLREQGSYEEKESYLSIPKLRDFLSRFGCFPDQHRFITWEFLLGLPNNESAYQNLAKKGLHPNFVNLKAVFPIESTQLYYRMQRILSCLAYYCPIFAELPYLSGMVFPFVKLLGVNESFCFETILSFLIQHGQHFFEFAPNPPVSYINSILELLSFQDPQLHQALTTNIPHVQLINAIWGSLQVSLTDMLNKQDWLCFIDFIVSRCEQPELILHFYVAYFLKYRNNIITFTSGAQLSNFFTNDHGLKIKDLLKSTLKLAELGNEGRISISFKDNLPLTREQYPIFNFYPKYSLDLHREMREQIIQDELKAREQKRTAEQINTLTLKFNALERDCDDQKDKMVRHDRDRRDIQVYEEEMRLTRMVAGEQEARQQRIQQLQMIEREQRATIDLANNAKRKELTLIDEEIAKKRSIDNKFIASQLEEEALMNLELKTAGRLHEVLDANSKEQRKNAIELTDQLARNSIALKYETLSRQTQAAIEEDVIRHSHQQQRKQLRNEIEKDEMDVRQLKGAQLAEEFEQELRLAEQERDRRIKLIEAGEQVKQEEFLSVYQLQEDVLRAEADVHLKRLEGKDYDLAQARTAERLRFVQEEKQQELIELQEHRKQLKFIQSQQNRAEAEEKIQDQRQRMLASQIQEEQKLASDITEIQRNRQAQRQIQQDIEFKEQEASQADQYRRILKLQKQAILNEEEANYQNVQAKLVSQKYNQSNSFQSTKNPAGTGQYNNSMPTYDNSQYYQYQQQQSQNNGGTAGFSQDNFYGNSQQNYSGQQYDDQQQSQSQNYGNYQQNPFNNSQNYQGQQQQYSLGADDQYDYMQDSLNQHSRQY